MTPRVEILLAVYRPPEKYLRELIRSLNSQDYQDIFVRILDDSVDEEISRVVEAVIAGELRDKPYSYEKNRKNLGAVGTFDKLTSLSQAQILAYCDQDDIWMPDKVSRLASLMESPGVTMAYCNQSIIDGNGNLRYNTLQDLRRRFVHRYGVGLAPWFLQNNCVTGACMLVRGEVARGALPFPAEYIHDQWLALNGALAGEIAYDPEPLVKYRLHGDNVVGMASLSGVEDKSSYVDNRLKPYLDMLEVSARRFETEAEFLSIIEGQRRALLVRVNFLSGRRRLFFSMIRYGFRDPRRLAFEILMGFLPRRAVEGLVKFAKNN